MKRLLFLLGLFFFSCQKQSLEEQQTIQIGSPVCVTIKTPTIRVSNKRVTPKTDVTVFYVDFDGQDVLSPYWNDGNLFSCAPSNFNSTDITNIINEVKKDFEKFKVLVTTDSLLYHQADIDKRMRIIVTPTSEWFPAIVGGAAHIGSLSWADSTPCFVFPNMLGNYPHFVAEIITHEVGHTVGLHHQSTYNYACVLTQVYNTGDGFNAPVMGNSLRAMNGGSWWKGPTPLHCRKMQDDIRILTRELRLK